MPRAAAQSLSTTTVTGLCVGATIGGALACAVVVANPIVSHLIVDGPEPLSTALALGGSLASFFAVGAALSGFVLELLSAADESGRTP